MKEKNIIITSKNTFLMKEKGKKSNMKKKDSEDKLLGGNDIQELLTSSCSH